MAKINQKMQKISLTQKLQLHRAGVELSSQASEKLAVKQMRKICKFAGKTVWSNKF